MRSDVIRVLVDGHIYGMQSHGGVGRCFTETLNRLGRHADDIEVIVHLPSNPKGTPPKGPGIRHVENWNIRPGRLFAPFSARVNMARIRALRPQIFHSTYYTLPYWPELRTVVTVHDFIDENSFQTMSGNYMGFVAHKRKVIERADAIIAVSHATKQDILKYTRAEADSISVIYHGINEDVAATSPTEEEINHFRAENRIREPYWLFVGRRLRYKNFGVLLRAWARVTHSYRIDSYLVAIGPHDGLESWQIDFLIRNRLEQRLVLLSRVDDRTLSVAYHGAAAFILPSLFEGFGIPLLEAMACNTPIIASDIPVLHEVASDAALYFDPHDEDALAEAMVQILDDRLRQDLAGKGQKRLSRFSWDKSARQIAEVYRSLV